MWRRLILAWFAFVLCSAPTWAAPLPLLVCCACVVAPGQASVCELLPEFEQDPFGQACASAGGSATCVASAKGTAAGVLDVPDIDCAEVLMDSRGIACPATTTAPAPALGVLGLGLLAVGLTALGARRALRARG